MILHKYAAALLSVAIVVGTAFVTIPEDARTPATLWQLGIFGLGAVVTYIVPVLDVKWAAILKTGAAIAAAIIGALIPLLGSGTLTATQWIVLILAGLNALAVEIGVSIRKDSTSLSSKDAASTVDAA